MKKSKDLGQIFTPLWVVRLILNRINYKGKHILEKKIFEPGFGDGAFLIQIVERYIRAAKKEGWSNQKTKKGLQSAIFGIEIDEEVYSKCLEKVNKAAEKEGIKNVRWSLYNEDALSFKESDERFDFVVGNPPYIRIHNLDKKIRDVLKKEYDFCKNGMIDIYLAFFELGLSVLKDDGVLAYITPNMFLRNSSNKDFRNYLIQNNLLTEMIDFGSSQIFEDANTYNCITKLKKNNKNTSFDYYQGDEKKIEKVNIINLKEYIDKKFIFSSKEDIDFVKNKQMGINIESIANVQYGFATLRDKIYITTDIREVPYEKNACLFNGEKVEKGLLKDVVKGSRMFDGDTLRKTKILFPYEKIGSRWVVIPEGKMVKDFPLTWEYLLQNREELEKRDMDKGTLWYEYGRSQAIQSVHKNKIIVDILVNGKINLEIVDKGTMVYSGIFITAGKKTLLRIKGELEKQDFLKYARILGKDMQGDYKSINTAIIKQYSV